MKTFGKRSQQLMNVTIQHISSTTRRLFIMSMFHLVKEHNRDVFGMLFIGKCHNCMRPVSGKCTMAGLLPIQRCLCSSFWLGKAFFRFNSHRVPRSRSVHFFSFSKKSNPASKEDFRMSRKSKWLKQVSHWLFLKTSSMNSSMNGNRAGLSVCLLMRDYFEGD